MFECTLSSENASYYLPGILKKLVQFIETLEQNNINKSKIGMTRNAVLDLLFTRRWQRINQKFHQAYALRARSTPYTIGRYYSNSNLGTHLVTSKVGSLQPIRSLFRTIVQYKVFIFSRT